MSNQYEVVFIMTPVLSEEQMMDTVNKFKKILTDNGSEIVHENNTELYYLLEFKAPGELIGKLETDYKRDERILRFLTVKLDKHAVTYNEKKRKNAALKKEEEKAS